MFSRRHFVTTSMLAAAALSSPRWALGVSSKSLYPDVKSPMECTKLSFAGLKKIL